MTHGLQPFAHERTKYPIERFLTSSVKDGWRDTALRNPGILSKAARLSVCCVCLSLLRTGHPMDSLLPSLCHGTLFLRGDDVFPQRVAWLFVRIGTRSSSASMVGSFWSYTRLAEKPQDDLGRAAIALALPCLIAGSKIAGQQAGRRDSRKHKLNRVSRKV